MNRQMKLTVRYFIGIVVVASFIILGAKYIPFFGIGMLVLTLLSLFFCVAWTFAERHTDHDDDDDEGGY